SFADSYYKYVLKFCNINHWPPLLSCTVAAKVAAAAARCRKQDAGVTVWIAMEIHDRICLVTR
ncbi:hypothetical protein LCGC14_3132810, partial [marine sediment metagenome]